MMRYGFTNGGCSKCAVSTELWEFYSYKEPLTLVESVRRPWNGFTGGLRQLIGSRRPLEVIAEIRCGPVYDPSIWGNPLPENTTLSPQEVMNIYSAYVNI
jgi:hypothetical protein